MSRVLITHSSFECLLQDVSHILELWPNPARSVTRLLGRLLVAVAFVVVLTKVVEREKTLLSNYEVTMLE